MSDPLASTLAELRRRLEESRPQSEPENGPGVGGDPEIDLWQLSEMELDRLMGRRLDELHGLLPPNPDLVPPPRSLPRRLRRRLALWVQRLLLLISGPQWHLNALLTEIGLATYVRHRLQERHQDELGERIEGLEQELALLRRRLGGGPEAPAGD